MITLVVSTDRPNSMTLNVAKAAKKLLQKMTNEKVLVLDLGAVDLVKLNTPAYESTSSYAHAIREKYFFIAQKILFIVPEYNGSFAGVLKYFIDIISTKDFERTFVGKTAAIIGVAQGRAGNLRGIAHLSNILMHMGMWVMPKNLPIAVIDKQFETDGNLCAATQNRMEELLFNFVHVAIS